MHRIKYCNKVVILALLALLVGCLPNKSLLTEKPILEVSEKLDAVVPALMKQADVVGLSLSVIRSGQLAISKSYGYADLDNKRVINQHTVFRAASLGKPIFAYVVLALVQHGKLNLDKPLFHYLDEKVIESDSRSLLITARMVLSHTTGLTNFNKGMAPEFQFEPGSGFQYSGHAYQYLQTVIEHIERDSFESLATKYVFGPVSMSQSSFVWRDNYQNVVAHSYNKSQTKSMSTQVDEAFAAWSLYTTANDYAKFVQHIMLQATAVNSVSSELLKPQFQVARDVKWGLGWGIQDTKPNPSFWHWGSLGGFRHYVVAYPSEKIAVLVMSNSSEAFKIVEDLMTQSIGGAYPSYAWF